MLFICLLHLLFSLGVNSVNVTLVSLGQFPASNAGFLQILDLPPPLYKTLIVTQFTGDPFAPDQVGSVSNLAAYFSGGGGGSNISAANVTELTNSVIWPNTATQLVAGSIAGISPASALIGGGFLVPPKSVGAVAVLQLDPTTGLLSSHTNISTDKGNAIFNGWFYHHALMRDIDGDGCQDALAARATKPLIGASAGELVWMRQPCGGSVTNPLAPEYLPWTEAVLVNGTSAPDVFIALASLRGDGVDEQVVYTSYFSGGGLALVNCAGCGLNGTRTWAQAAAASDLSVTMLDASIGLGFSASLYDLNGDGVLDILATNHVDNASLSGVFAYEAPPPGVPITQASAWTKHVLASGFIVREGGPNQASPGTALAVPSCSSPKPFLTIAGDGDQRFYTLVPNTELPTDWTYTLNQILDCKGTVGAQAAGDLDGDGCPDHIFVPCYDSGIVHAFSIQS